MSAEVFPHLQRAPATEAIVELRVKPRPNANPALLKHLLKPGYRVEEVTAFSEEIEFTPSGRNLKEQTSQGFRFIANDGRVIVMAMVDRLSTSRLQPYTEWADLVSTAHEFYQRYVTYLQPERVVRLGVRYVNRLELPANVRDLSRYLTAPPAPFPGTAGSFVGFVRRTITTEREGVGATVTMAVDDTRDMQTGVILDIDCWSDRTFLPLDSEIWHYLDTFRATKNRIFFANITADARSMYE